MYYVQLQYIGGYLQYMGGITSVQWGITSVLWRVFSTVEEIFNFDMLGHQKQRKDIDIPIRNFHSQVSKF